MAVDCLSFVKNHQRNYSYLIKENGMTLNQEEVKTILHHRDPYLLIDEVVDITENSITTTKTLLGSEFFLEGHFPDAKIMPGAMMQEMATQSAGVLITKNYSPVENYNSETTTGHALGVLSRVHGSKFKGFAKPGDKLNMEVKLIEAKDNAFEFKAKLKKQDDIIMSIAFRLVNISDEPLKSLH